MNSPEFNGSQLGLTNIKYFDICYEQISNIQISNIKYHFNYLILFVIWYLLFDLNKYQIVSNSCGTNSNKYQIVSNSCGTNSNKYQIVSNIK